MRKKFLIFSIVCLLFCILSYTYSSFKNTIVGNISGNIKDWVFKVSIDNSTKYEDGYKLHLTGTNGSFNININTVGGSKNASYSIELIGDSSIKYYADSGYTKLINNNIYKDTINSNISDTITIYYKSSSNINDDIYVKTKGSIMKIAMMKNGYSSSNANGGTEFWNNTYKPYIRTIEFGNDLGNLPSSCTETNLCWDVSYDVSQENKVYAHLTDSGYKDSIDNTKTLYNLYIVSETPILAPPDCIYMFSFSDFDNTSHADKSNLIQINFNNNFDTSKVTRMRYAFFKCSSLTSLDLTSFNTASVTDMCGMFYYCSSLTSLDLSNFNTSNVTSMNGMFVSCSSLNDLNIQNFDTSKVTNMSMMFETCSSLTNLDLSNLDTSKVTNMGLMFYNCSKITTTINIMNANITNYSVMFYNAATISNSKITVNYIADASSLVDNMIATKSSNSNVVKGNQI